MLAVLRVPRVLALIMSALSELSAPYKSSDVLMGISAGEAVQQSSDAANMMDCLD